MAILSEGPTNVHCIPLVISFLLSFNILSMYDSLSPKLNQVLTLRSLKSMVDPHLESPSYDAKIRPEASQTFSRSLASLSFLLPRVFPAFPHVVHLSAGVRHQFRSS